MRNADALDLRGDARFKAAVFLVALLQHQGKDQDVGDDAKLKQSAKLGSESQHQLSDIQHHIATGALHLIAENVKLNQEKVGFAGQANLTQPNLFFLHQIVKV